jgi:putative restriction endonuclease
MNEHVLEYRYRGSDPSHRDNAGLREAMLRKVPLIYLHGLVVGRYLAHWPVYVLDDDPAHLTFRVELDQRQLGRTDASASGDYELERGYAEVTVLRRLHQRTFQARVLEAYRESCALCSLRHRELLDAAHIVPDKEERGEPVVSNGLALCKLHHAAFDQNILGIRPDLIVEVRGDVLEEIDGPMLKHGLQGFHGARIHIPARLPQQPDPDRLHERYERFRRAS